MANLVDPTQIGPGRPTVKLEEMLEYSGGTREVPVIVEGEKVTIGYGGT
jgi:hypothetical protein